MTHGSRGYLAWMTLLLAVVAVGAAAYLRQLDQGMIVTNMRDQVAWGFYIGNFTFLVGVAAAAVVLVVPAYIYRWKPIREVVLLGELLSISAIIMSMLFVTIDIGRPERLLHLMPGVGTPNFPYSMLAWDILVLSAYFAMNYFIVTYILFAVYTGRPYSTATVLSLIFLTIPMAISIHTVTAFLFVGLKARPFWNSAILAPRFLASAFCSGPALLIIVFQILRHLRPIRITDEALRKIGEILAYTMAANLFLLGCEVFRDLYSHSSHVTHTLFQWGQLHGSEGIGGFTWFALTANVIAFVIFVNPLLRQRMLLLNVACVLTVAGVYIEKGLGLMLPGLTPDALGEIYRYTPSLNEIAVAAGVWGIGALCFTLMAKVAMAISLGEFRAVPRRSEAN